MGAEIARRGYNAVPVEDLHFDRVAGIIPVSRIVVENGVGAEARPIALG